MEPSSSSVIRAEQLTTAHTVTERRDKQSPMFVQLATREQCVKVHRVCRIVEAFVAHARTRRLTEAIDKRAQRSRFFRQALRG